jgi:ankyrin repeat protein
MKSSHKKLIGLAILLLFLVPLGMSGNKVYRELRQPELNHALIAAAKRGDTAAVVSLLREGADPNARDLPPDARSMWLRLWDRIRGKTSPTEDGPAALLVALSANKRNQFPPENVPLAKVLLNAGASVNISDQDGTTPLMLATQAKRHETVRLLLETGAKVNTRDHRGDTVISDAAAIGDSVLSNVLLSHGSIVNTRSIYGRTPLHYAASNGQIVTTRLLLENRADVNARDTDGETALNNTVFMGHVDCVKLLISWGAQVNTGDIVGRTPLFWAQDHKDSALVKMLTKAGAKE